MKEQTSEERVAKNGDGRRSPDESKDYNDSKKVKEAIVAPERKPTLTLSTGFESRYIYHGVDIVGFNSNVPPTVLPLGLNGNKVLHKAFFDIQNGQPKANATSPIAYVNASFEWKGFQLTASYIHATDTTVPSRVQIFNEAQTYNRFYNSLQNYGPLGIGNQIYSYNVHPYQRTYSMYQEIDVNVDYTLGIIANVLDATVGYNSFIIPDHEFKGTNYQGEALFRLSYKQIPYIEPSVSYYRYISDANGFEFVQTGQNRPLLGAPLTKPPFTPPSTGAGFVVRQRGEYLNGNYIEAKIDSSIPLFSTGAVAATLKPYVLISANDGYITKNVVGRSSYTEFNTFESGVKLPVSVGEHFAVTPYVNYGYDISDSHYANDFRGKLPPFKTDIWGGVTCSYRF